MISVKKVTSKLKPVHLLLAPWALIFIGTVMVFVSTNSAVSKNNSLTTGQNDNAQSQKDIDASKEKTAKLAAGKNNPATTPAPPSAKNKTTPASTSAQTKYATSSDPRSTAYSIVSPVPSATTFSTNITHNGQVAPGTLIGNNNTKHTQTYYGGDLILSPASVTISKSSGSLNAPFSVNIPDGAVSNLPTMPWNDQSSIGVIATQGSTSSSTNWTMIADLYSSAGPGTYTMHLQTFRSSPGEPAWEYDGFLTVTVTN